MGNFESHPLSIGSYLFKNLNKDNTMLFFIKNTKPKFYFYFYGSCWLNASTNLNKYLDLPSLVGNFRFNVYKSILDKVGQKFGNCKNKFISQAGK